MNSYELKAEQIINIATFEYPPFMNSELDIYKGHGFGIEVTREAFRRVFIKTRFNFYPLKRSIYEFNSGNTDAHLGTIYHFREAQKQKKVVWVNILKLKFSFYYLKDRLKLVSYNKLSDLSRYTIGNVRGSSTSKKLADAGLNLDWTNSIQQNFIKFFKERFDLCVAEEHTALYILKNIYPDIRNRVVKVEKPLLVVPKSLTFHSSGRDLADHFKKGLEMTRKDGTYEKLFIKYFGRKDLEN